MSFKKNGLLDGKKRFRYGLERNNVTFTPASADGPAKFEEINVYKENPSSTYLIDRHIFSHFQTFQASDGECYINIPVLNGDGTLVFKWTSIPSEPFARFMSRMIPQISLKTVEAYAADLKSLISYNRPPLPLYNRIANLGDVIYYDLNDAEGNIVEIRAKGWKIVQESPVPFNTTGLPVPIPESGGTIALLMPYLNIKPDDFSLAYAWVLSALWQDGKYPILYITGPHGSGKSTITRILRNLVDPVATPLNEPPSSIREMNVYAHNTVVVAYNNVSKITDAMSDAFCRMATEGGAINRKLFTNAEQSTLSTNRPVIINGITAATYRPDFHNRTLFLKSELLADTDYPAFAKQLDKYPSDYPKIMGALFDGLVAALKNKGSTVLDKSPRMVEAATLVTAAEPGMGIESGTFVKRFMKQQQDGMLDAIENTVVGSFVYHTLLGTKTQWVGTRTEILEAIKADSKVFGLKPNTAQAVTRALTDLVPVFAALGILINFEYRRGNDRLISIYRDNVVEADFSKPRIERVRLNRPNSVNQPAVPRKASK